MSVEVKPDSPRKSRTQKRQNQCSFNLLKDHQPEQVASRFLASQCIGNTLALRYWKGSYWKWRDGRYVEVSDGDMQNQLVVALGQSYSNIRRNDVSNVMMNIAARSSVTDCESMPQWFDGSDEVARTWQPEDTFATKSHIIHLPSLVSGLDHHKVAATPLYFNAVAADYEFDIEARPPARWLQFLDELFDDDDESKGLLRQWFGYCLTGDTRQQKIMLMVGPKRSGKGTIASVLRALVGNGNCCAPTLAGLSTNFGLQPLIGKTLAILGDARISNRTDVAATTERLLSISGEDAQTIDRKHKEPITIQLPTRFTIISNELPRLNDASGALAGRLVILRFTRSFFGNEDKSLRTALHAERQSILNWAIGGWAELRERGRFIEPRASQDLVDQMADIASPITAFVGDCCKIENSGLESLDQLYESFRRWSESNGIGQPMTKAIFSRDLGAAYPDLSRSRASSGAGDGKRKRFIRGIALVDRRGQF